MGPCGNEEISLSIWTKKYSSDDNLRKKLEEIIVRRDDDSFDLLYSRNIEDQVIPLKDYVLS